MSDEQVPQADNGEDQRPRFSLRGQYIKDLSLENPHAPESLLGGQEQPKVDLNLDLQARAVQQNLFELSMVFNIKGVSDKTLFALELNYGGLFELVNIPENAVERVLLVDSAFSLFPFARRVIADSTRDAGFPPLVLEPIDFLNLYERRRQQEGAAQQEAVSDEASTPAQGSEATH
jgi:preprotein translocase subunit SecB